MDFDTTPSAILPRANPACQGIALPRHLIHDLLQPVNALALLADELLEVAKNDIATSGLATQMHQAIESDASLLNSLRQYIRIQTGQMLPRLEVICIDDIVPTVVAEFSNRFPDLEVELLSLQQSFWIQTDPGFLTQILSCLLDNARTFAQRRISIFCEIDVCIPSSIVINIRDDGPGVCNELIERLGTPFMRRVNGQRRKRQGLGLGIFIAASLAESMDNHLVYTRTRTGSQFSLKIKAATSTNQPCTVRESTWAAGLPCGISISLLYDELQEPLELKQYLDAQGFSVFLESLETEESRKLFRPNMYIVSASKLEVLEAFLKQDAVLTDTPPPVGVIVLDSNTRPSENLLSLAAHVVIRHIPLPISPSRLRAAIEGISMQLGRV